MSFQSFKFKSLLLFFILIPYSNASEISLETKLTNQWRLYDIAQEFLLQNPRYLVLSRERWESLINPTEKYAFNKNDMDKIRYKQSLEKIRYKNMSVKNSLFDLNIIRSYPDKLENFCSQIPKGGLLHVHPFGSISYKILKKILKKHDPIIDMTKLRVFLKSGLKDKSKSSLKDNIKFLDSLPMKFHFSSLQVEQQQELIELCYIDNRIENFEKLDMIFNILASIINTDEMYIDALKEYGYTLSKQKVTYLEFTTNILKSKLHLYYKVADIFEKDFGIILRINNAFHRTLSKQVLFEQANKSVKLKSYNTIISGVDLHGNENSVTALSALAYIFPTLKNINSSNEDKLHITIHAGEFGDPRNPRDAIILGAERIGHGLSLIKDPIALEYAKIKKISIESCLTSNLKMNAISDLKNHPYLEFLRLGLNVSLSTDDEGIFKTDINTECVRAIENTDLTYYELKQMIFNSIKSSFCSPSTKRHLLNNLNDSFDSFERYLDMVGSTVNID